MGDERYDVVVRNLLQAPRNLAVFVALSSIFVIHPFAEHEGRWSQIVLNVTIALTILSSIYSMTTNRRRYLIARAIGIPAVAFGVFAVIYETTFLENGQVFPEELGYVRLVLFLAFFTYSFFGLTVSLFQQNRVTVDVLLGATSAYLILGLVFGLIFAMVQQFSIPSALEPEGEPSEVVQEESSTEGKHQDDGGDPMEAFVTSSGKALPRLGEKGYTLSPYFYFSFVTLTTLGYGDITPRTPPAQMLSVYEAIIGQLYLAVLMAMLLGMYLAHRNEKKPDDL